MKFVLNFMSEYRFVEELNNRDARADRKPADFKVKGKNMYQPTTSYLIEQQGGNVASLMGGTVVQFFDKTVSLIKFKTNFTFYQGKSRLSFKFKID